MLSLPPLRAPLTTDGASPEVRVLPGGSTRLTKWRTLGRISHENAVVMPDSRTVYTTDDHPNGGTC